MNDSKRTQEGNMSTSAEAGVGGTIRVTLAAAIQVAIRGAENGGKAGWREGAGLGGKDSDHRRDRPGLPGGPGRRAREPGEAPGRLPGGGAGAR